MSLLKKPNEISDSILLCGLIYGQPGIGKSTLALSGPNPVIIDADRGLRRVEKRFQTESLPLEDYKDVIALFDSNELAPFDTVVFDTLGRLLERMSDYLIIQNPKLKQGDGTLSMKGWGALKIEFQNLLKKAKAKNKHLIFVAHEKEEKDGDIRIVRPDVPGSSGKDIVKDLDFMGYMEMRGDKRSVSFNPSERFYAKNSLKLPPYIEVPNTDLHGNTFITDFILQKTIDRQKSDDVENAKYDSLVSEMNKVIDTVKDAKTADAALQSINDAAEIWDSKRRAKKLLNEKVKAAGLEYDVKAKKFKALAKDKADKGEQEAA